MLGGTKKDERCRGESILTLAVVPNYLCYPCTSSGQGCWVMVLGEVSEPHNMWQAKECRFYLDVMGHMMNLKQEALRMPLRRKRKFRSCLLDQNKMAQ